jgi:hypothetical protein
MIKKTFQLMLLFVLLLFNACAPYAPSDLAGKWKAVELSEEGDSLKVDASNVYFRFLESGRYEYYSTLNYHESGMYKLDGKYLLSTDTTRSDQAEKAVEIVKLVNDSLVLKMKEQGKERLMVLIKQ